MRLSGVGGARRGRPLAGGAAPAGRRLLRLLLVGLLRPRRLGCRKTRALLRALLGHAAGRAVAPRLLRLPLLDGMTLRPWVVALLGRSGPAGLRLPGRARGHTARLLRTRVGWLLGAVGAVGAGLPGLLLPRLPGPRARSPGRLLAAGGVLVGLLGPGGRYLARGARLRLLRGAGRRGLAVPGVTGGRLRRAGVLRRRSTALVGLLGPGGGNLARGARLRLLRGAGRYLSPGAPAVRLGIRRLLPAGRAVGGLLGVLGVLGVLAGGRLRPRRPARRRRTPGRARLRSGRGRVRRLGCAAGRRRHRGQRALSTRVGHSAEEVSAVRGRSLVRLLRPRGRGVISGVRMSGSVPRIRAAVVRLV
ncbi:hypothetical protein [Streptomonospora wellingtoniae]|uniref:Uncharacterized protein n=1 Tax=Streptomonospora wellingtoniae TaxID=3075544 RepID=A0ABU2KV98_9ACTN|nr:hypothetical protein [Streptomonospora sp. DSM 45055]MDT0303220.1 hypothetical protein [Streptomonospora sp. DSM 45055]